MTDFLFTAPEIAWHFRCAPGTIYRWVHEDAHRRFRVGRWVYYDLRDMQQSWDRRHGVAA